MFSAALRVNEARRIYFIGGGGKTTLMYALGRELCEAGERVLCTTTTRILPPPPERSPTLIVKEDAAALSARLDEVLSETGRLAQSLTLRSQNKNGYGHGFARMGTNEDHLLSGIRVHPYESAARIRSRDPTLATTTQDLTDKGLGQPARAVGTSSIPGPTTLARAISANGKLLGFSPEVIDELVRDSRVARILVEADGSRGRSLKAHEDHEPVISPHAELVVAVIGIDCVGARLEEAAVFRAERFSRLLGRPMGSMIRPEDVASIVLHQDGYLRKVPSAARLVVALNKVESAERRAVALDCAEALGEADKEGRLEGIVLTSVRGDDVVANVV